MKDFFTRLAIITAPFLVAISSLVSIVAFVTSVSFGVNSGHLLYFSLPILIITLPLVLRRKAYFHFVWIWLLGPALIGLVVMGVKAIDTFLF